MIVIVDAFTHYVVVNPVVSATAVNVLGTFFDHWVTKFGIPENIVTDNGTEYINTDITHFCQMYDIRHKPRTTHAPWTNGLVEGTNRYLGEYLRTTCENGHADWNERAKAFALVYNITTRSKMDLSPYELVFMEKRVSQQPSI